ncbi:MAG TPA: hypothetical protein VFH89_07505 [Sphingomicrobium sp.]|nr:hypothetical protein [Sphingomicrobium sp.]
MDGTWQAHLRDDIPRMAWLAKCGPNGNIVHHGIDVEVRGDGFFEGAWSGRFEDWEFASAATVAGSGAIATTGGILFVTPSHTLEGLYYHRAGDAVTVSNSIVFLLRNLGLAANRDPHFGGRLASTVKGIDHYSRHVADTDKGPVSRAVFHNLHLRGGEISETPKTDGFSFSGFAEYRAALSRELQQLFDNAAAPARKRSYRPISTCSSGYDSTACLVLAGELGCRDAVTLALGEGVSDDSGKAIAEQLGMGVKCFERSGPDDDRVSEFVATGMGGEDLAYAAFENDVAGSVLLTGFHGDRIWSKGVAPNDCLERGDVSGSSLGEFRLRCGFVHAPLPFIGALHHRAVAKISESGGMAPWSIGGWYDRPIPRRIAEEAGIKRTEFGQSKKAASLPSRAARPNAKLGHRVRENLFSARLAAARLLQKAAAPRFRLRWLMVPLRNAIAGDPRTFEHDSPDAYFRFRTAIDHVGSRYPLL